MYTTNHAQFVFSELGSHQFVMKLCQVLYLWVGTAAVLLGNQPADDIQKYTVTVQVTGPPWEQGLTIAIAKNGKVKTELAHNMRVQLLGQTEGELTHVGTPNDDHNACSYKAGDIYTSCYIGKHEVIFQSKAEVQNTLKVMLLVTKKGQGNEAPFEVKIDDVTKCIESAPIQQDTTWWRIFDVDGAGSIVKLWFPSTNNSCMYTVANKHDKKTCEIDGWNTEFETVETTSDLLSQFKKIPTTLWSVRIQIEGSGPHFEIWTNHDKRSTEAHDGYVSLVKTFDADIGDRLRLKFENDEYIYSINNKQRFVNVKGFNFEMEPIPKSE